jgi:hypothetical protein
MKKQYKEKLSRLHKASRTTAASMPVTLLESNSSRHCIKHHLHNNHFFCRLGGKNGPVQTAHETYIQKKSRPSSSVPWKPQVPSFGRLPEREPHPLHRVCVKELCSPPHSRFRPTIRCPHRLTLFGLQCGVLAPRWKPPTHHW